MPNNTFYYTISAKTNEDISWYIGQENVSEYTLKTTAQLFGFAALVNGTAKRADGTLVNSVNFSGKTIYLANDVDVSGYGVDSHRLFRGLHPYGICGDL